LQQEISITISAISAEDENIIKQECAAKIGVNISLINHVKVLRKSIDARGRTIKQNLTVLVIYNQAPDFIFVEKPIVRNYNPLNTSKAVIIVGAGPAGLFAALKLIELGIKPIIIERGKNVQERRRDLAAINKQHIVNPESNYCFGEGGAGTYSDGKLYTRSTKRGDVTDVLQTLVYHGADENILVEAHPHIGTNKLPKIIEKIRQNILDAGGEVWFNTKLVDIEVKENKVKSIVTKNTFDHSSIEFDVQEIIFATGHSARDIYELLDSKNVHLEAKPFALGVRVEHPQHLIDKTQYHCANDAEVEEKRNYLPAASYSWVHQVQGRGVYSFCMCPGGIIAPCATSQNEIVTNGWSPSKRNNPYSNSGIVVSVNENDYLKYKHKGALAGMYFQQEIEHNAWLAGGKTQTAPAQSLLDFVNKKQSSSLPLCSYIPGVTSVEIDNVLPTFIANALREGFKMQGLKMRNYLSNDALIVATESRTSTPVRIPRMSDTLHHTHITNLYPCGEGAGYAGGIVSAAMDGEKIAKAIAAKLN